MLSRVRPVAVGLGAGLGGALALSRVLQAMLFDVAPTDPSADVAATLALALGIAPVTALGGD